MKITLCIEQDADSAACRWPEVAEVVRHWAAGHAAAPPDLPSPELGKMEMSLQVRPDDLLTAVRGLHDALYDLDVNFTVSVD